MVASGQQDNIRMVVIEGNSIIMFRSFGTRINNGYVQQKNQLLTYVPLPKGLSGYDIKLRLYTVFVLNCFLKKNIPCKVLCPHSPCSTLPSIVKSF